MSVQDIILEHYNNPDGIIVTRRARNSCIKYHKSECVYYIIIIDDDDDDDSEYTTNEQTNEQTNVRTDRPNGNIKTHIITIQHSLIYVFHIVNNVSLKYSIRSAFNLIYYNIFL